MGRRTLGNAAIACLALTALVRGQATWVNWIRRDYLPDARSALGLAYDSARGRLVVFGGSGAKAYSDTWEFDGTQWLLRSLPTSPTARFAHAMVYDEARQRVLLFGGSTGDLGTSQPFSDTWSYDGNAWVLLNPATSPPARAAHAMTWDVNRARVVLFGGLATTATLHSDTWEWDGTTWTQRATTGPSARYQHAMAHDSTRGKTVLFGGVVPGKYFGDTWEWDGNAWQQIAPTVSPSGRWDHAMAYDRTSGRIVLFGGNLGDPLIWEWDGFAWASRPGSTYPTPGAYMGMALCWDQGRSQIVLFGGRAARWLNELWDWNGNVWSQRLLVPTATAGRVSIAYDLWRGRCLYVGGAHQQASETWEWDGVLWRLRSPTTTPPPGAYALAFDTLRGRAVALGGSPLSMWEWDGTAWTQIAPAVMPPQRDGHALAYDSLRRRVVLFGGYAGQPFADTWEWDGATWTQKSPPVSPSPRRMHSMVFDSVRGRVLLFGGEDAFTIFGELWEWDGTTWTKRTPAVSPLPRSGHGMAFDAARGLTVLFGGMQVPIKTETWEWDGSDWRRRLPAMNPLAEGNPPVAMAYDLARSRVVLFGAPSGTLYPSGTWEYGPDWPASAQSHGVGCPGGAGTPLLGVVGPLPWLGFPFETRLTGIGTNPTTDLPFLLLGDSRTRWGSFALPLDLSPFGMPGCSLLTSVLTSFPLVNAGGYASWSLQLPGEATLVGASVHAQGGVTSPGTNALGVVVSNAFEWRLGWK